MRGSSTDFRSILDPVPDAPQEIRVEDRRPLVRREHPLLCVVSFSSGKRLLLPLDLEPLELGG
jgi:hypothetical protein